MRSPKSTPSPEPKNSPTLPGVDPQPTAETAPRLRTRLRAGLGPDNVQ
jgi:hypothetical protein